MASDWKFCKIGDVAKIQGGYAFKSKDFSDTGTPVIKIKNVRKRDIDLTDVARVSQEVAEQASSFLVKSWDVLISMTGSGPNAPASIVGRVARHSGEDDVFLINQRVGRFLIKEKEQLDQRFLYYLFSEDKTQLELLSIATGSANQVNISGKQIESIEVNLPPLSEQKAIAHILGSLDDKIELNRQMNETLEAMAQALFKSWFVDFAPVIDNVLAAGNTIPDEVAELAEHRKGIEKKDNSDIQKLFPDEFEFTEEMGWIPKGWEAKCIKDIGRVVTGKTPPKKIDNAYSEDGTPFITPTDIDDLPFVVYTNRYLSEDGVKAVKNSRISAGSICVTCIGSQMGKTTISPFASVSNQQINSITDCNQFWRNYLFFNLRRRREEIFLLGSSGSTMPILNKSNFEAVPILCPSEKLLSSLDSHFQSTIDSILENTEQNETLCKLRDTLLPQLMSGELRIPDAEVLVEEVL